jgi:hypothetical protein
MRVDSKLTELMAVIGEWVSVMRDSVQRLDVYGKNSREDSLLELEERVKVQLENITKKNYKECILLTPPFLGGKLVSSCVVYYGI